MRPMRLASPYCEAPIQLWGVCPRSEGWSATTLLLEGSDHALSDFEQHLPFVLHFLQLIP